MSARHKQVIEAEANLFALMLLVPEKFLRAEMLKMEIELCNDDQIFELARIFNVSVACICLACGQYGIGIKP